MLPNGHYGHAADAGALEAPQRENIIAVFYSDRRLNAKKSKLKGSAVHETVDMVKMYMPGDHTSEQRQVVTDEIRRRFFREYNAFKEGSEQINGEPLENWYEIAQHADLVDEMKRMKIRSVEDLANITDMVTSGAMWGVEWRKKARAYLEARKSKEALAESNSALVAQLAEMQKQLDALKAAPPVEQHRGPGRPPVNRQG